MSVTALLYGNGALGQFSTTTARRVNWTGDTINVGLATSSYTPNQDTDDFYNDITNELTTTGGYTAGGAALGSKSTSYDSASNETRLIAASSAWTSYTGTSRYAFVYSSTGTSSTSPLLAYVNFGADEVVSAGTFTIAWDATHGVITWTVS